MLYCERFLSRTINAATMIAAIALLLLMCHITADVIAKSVFSSPLPGTIVIASQYYMVAVVFLPLAFAEQNSRHISVEVLVEHFSVVAQFRLNAFAALYSAAIFGFLTWRGLREALRKTEIGAFIIEQDVRIDIWPAYYLLPIGTGLMVATLAYKLVRYFQTNPRTSIDQPF